MKKNFKILFIVYLAIYSLETFAGVASITDSISYGTIRMKNIISLPVLDKGIRVKYEGSIDKQGKNADWNWSLYQDEKGEWVIFDVEGSGCIYNLVQHRYISSQEPTFRFYFDGEKAPRFTIRLSEFGEKYPFVRPLASSYIGPLDNGRGPIRVSRSFVPMSFQKGCRITTDIKLQGHDRSKGEGGWGHVLYHTFNTTNEVKPFTETDNYDSVIQLWKNQGSNPFQDIKLESKKHAEKIIPAGERLVLLDKKGQGSINGIKLNFAETTKMYLQDIWIHMYWDNHVSPDISCPIGCLAGNSLGFNDTQYLLSGFNRDGWIYNYFPMPFWENATIIIENRGIKPASLAFSEIAISDINYDKSGCGYFRNTPYYERQHVAGKDSPIGIVKGSGKMVAAHITCYGERPNIITCEGDVRVYIDGNRTPQVESDGSESYVCYGWGFPTPPETHPSGGYDGLPDNPWSMTRLCIGDSYPFYSELKFGIESGEYNNQYLEHSGTIFYYGRDKAALIKTDSLDLSSPNSIKKHKYHALGNLRKERLNSYFEGNMDNTIITGEVYHFNRESCFRIKIHPDNDGICLRRLSDQSLPRQAAKVFVDGYEIADRLWYVADKNTYKRWLEDDFDIPSEFTAGKTSVEIRIIPINKCGTGEPTWNEAAYQIFSYIK